jgi:hypothetical protein
VRTFAVPVPTETLTAASSPHYVTTNSLLGDRHFEIFPKPVLIIVVQNS